MTPPPTFRAWAYPPIGRFVVGALFALALASLPAILAVVLLAHDPPATPGDVMRLFRDLTVLPWVLACLVRHAFRAEVTVRADLLVIARPGVTLEVAPAAIARLRPWRLPLPTPGCTLFLRSGARLQDGELALHDPAALLTALAAVGVSAARAALADPVSVWARARAARPPWRWYHYAARFPLYALVPTAVLFNLHQHVAYGHWLGEYYLRGAAS